MDVLFPAQRRTVRHDPRAGYLLLEILISMAVFSIGFLALGTLVASTSANNTTGNIATQATLLAAETLERLKSSGGVAAIAPGAYGDGTPVDARGVPGGIFTRTAHRGERVMSARPDSRTEAGFSLLELLVALGLAAVVLGVLVSFFQDFGRASTKQNAAAEAQQTARAGLDFLLRELRMAGLDPLQRSGAGIEEIAPDGTRIRFTADFCDLAIGGGTCTAPEPDGSVEGAGERITYLYDPARRELRRMLYEGTPSGSGTATAIVSQVSHNPGGIALFTFLDANGDPVTDNAQRAAIRSVVVTLTIEEPAGRASTVSRTYTARVALRNIRL
jgi:type IV pilus assembly protein PilW